MRAREPNFWPIYNVTEHGLGNWQLSSSSDGNQLSKYMLEVEDHYLATSGAIDTMNSWKNRVNIYDKLFLIALDILAAAASQAYVERAYTGINASV